MSTDLRNLIVFGCALYGVIILVAIIAIFRRRRHRLCPFCHYPNYNCDCPSNDELPLDEFRTKD